jgi:hypothetical protein
LVLVQSAVGIGLPEAFPSEAPQTEKYNKNRGVAEGSGSEEKSRQKAITAARPLRGDAQGGAAERLKPLLRGRSNFREIIGGGGGSISWRILRCQFFRRAIVAGRQSWPSIMKRFWPCRLPVDVCEYET